MQWFNLFFIRLLRSSNEAKHNESKQWRIFMLREWAIWLMNAIFRGVFILMFIYSFDDWILNDSVFKLRVWGCKMVTNLQWIYSKFHIHLFNDIKLLLSFPVPIRLILFVSLIEKKKFLFWLNSQPNTESGISFDFNVNMSFRVKFKKIDTDEGRQNRKLY